MSLRFVFWIAVLGIGCLWTFYRPIVGVCLGILFFTINPTGFGAGLEDLRFQFIATICLGLSYVLHYGSFKKPTWKAQTPMILILAWLVWCAIGSTWAVHSSKVAFDACERHLKIVIFAFLISRIVSSEKDMRTVLWTAFISFGLKAIVDRWFHAWGFGVQKGLLGGVCDGIVLFLPAMMLMVLSSGKWWEWVVAIGLAPFMLDQFVSEGRRSAFSNLALCGLLAVVFSPKGIRRRVMLVVAAAAILFVSFLANPRFWDRMTTILDPQSEASAASRFWMNRASWAMANDHPFGVGLENYGWVSKRYYAAVAPGQIDTEGYGKTAHNTFLSVLTETGFPGLLLWVGAFGAAWLQLARLSLTPSAKEHPRAACLMARGLCLGMLSILPGLWTHTGYGTDFIYWVVGLSVALQRIVKQPGKDARVQLDERMPPTGTRRTLEAAPCHN